MKFRLVNASGYQILRDENTNKYYKKWSEFTFSRLPVSRFLQIWGCQHLVHSVLKLEFHYPRNPLLDLATGLNSHEPELAQNTFDLLRSQSRFPPLNMNIIVAADKRLWKRKSFVTGIVLVIGGFPVQADTSISPPTES